MPTVEEVLRQSGFTDDQIARMDQRAITAFGGVMSAADKERQEAQAAREAAELAQRSNIDFYDNRIVPSLVQWEAEKARLDGELGYYRAQHGSLVDSGLLPPDSRYQQPRDGQGRYVANAPGGTPGSPQFFDVNQIYNKAGDAVGIIADIEWEHRRLYDQPLPISPTELIRRADAVKLDPRSYAAREFNWDQKRQELAQKAKDDEKAAIVKEVEARKDREWAERIGSNPDVRMPLQSPRMTDIARATKRGERPDPLSMGENERRQATRQAIRSELLEEAR